MAKNKPSKGVSQEIGPFEYCGHCHAPVMFLAGPFGPTTCPFGRVHIICEDMAVVLTAIEEREGTDAARDHLVAFVQGEVLLNAELARREFAR